MLDFNEIKYEDIPKIDLYMDQVTSFLDDVLEGYKINDDDKIMTKTMINNYVKANIIDKPVKKKYSQDHMAKMIMIFFFKNIISMDEIEKIFSMDIETKALYEKFNAINKKFYEESEKQMDGYAMKEEKMEVILSLIIQADINKRLAEMLIKAL
ncbi:MAG: DUF1836 domain-containing protein [Clostridiales bacterium]|nr:DUF1836 domain-containing protein [Clostridiales bacterium]